MSSLLHGFLRNENAIFPLDYLLTVEHCDKCFALLYDADLWNLALIASDFTSFGLRPFAALKTDFSYGTLGWNTFPVPTLTEQNKADLTRCAEDILLAREAHFPATIADLYDPDTMPANLREPTSATTRRWSASTSAAASRTTPSGWKNSSNSTPDDRGRPREEAARKTIRRMSGLNSIPSSGTLMTTRW